MPPTGDWLFGIVFIRDRASKFYWASYTLYNHPENHILFQHPNDMVTYRYQIKTYTPGMGITESHRIEVESADFYYYY